MCEHCGCRQVEPLAEPMDEHVALLDQASAHRHQPSLLLSSGPGPVTADLGSNGPSATDPS